MGDGESVSFSSALEFTGNSTGILEQPFEALAGRSELSVMQEAMTYVVVNPPRNRYPNLRERSESAATPTKLADLIDLILVYMPEKIFQLACRLPISAMMLVQKYKRVTDELARQLVAQQEDNNDSESFVSHLCVYRIQHVADLTDTSQCAPTSKPIPQLSHPVRSQSTCVQFSWRELIRL
jgi:hypothetical protein